MLLTQIFALNFQFMNWSHLYTLSVDRDILAAVGGPLSWHGAGMNTVLGVPCPVARDSPGISEPRPVPVQERGIGQPIYV